MRVLVIGGTGFIGAQVARALDDLGHQVTVFHRGATNAELPERIGHFWGDHGEVAALRDARERVAPEVVVHMVPMNERDATRVATVFAGHVGRLVAISSVDVYRARNRLFGIEPGVPDPVPLGEDAPLRELAYPYRGMAPGPDHPFHDYDKIPVERVVLGNRELPGTVLRLPMVYGPGDGQHRLWEFLRRMDDGRAAIPLAASRATWRWSRGYVGNLARAVALAATHERAAGEIYNVADEPTLTEAEWVRAIGDAAGWRGEVVAVPDGTLPDPFGIPLDWRQELVASTRKLREHLGYEPAVSLTEALARSVEWERRHPPAETPLIDYAVEDAALAAAGATRA